MASKMDKQPSMNQRTRLLEQHRELADQIDGIDAKLEVIEGKLEYLAKLRERLLAGIDAQIDPRL